MKALWLTERFLCDIISLNREMMKRVMDRRSSIWKRISMGHVEAMSISIRVTVAVIMTIMSRLAAADMTIISRSIAVAAGMTIISTSIDAAADMTIMNTSIAAVMKIMSRSVAAAAAVPAVMNMETMDRIRKSCCV